MIEMLIGYATSNAAAYIGGSILVVVAGWILKKIPFARFAKWAEEIGRAQGLAVTTFFNSKLPKLWNSVIEPVFIDTINAVLFAWIRGFIAGLKSDNKE
jgi:hypothetical protein